MKRYKTTTTLFGEVIRKVELGTDDRYGCIDDDRRVGPWEEQCPGNWRRKGPDGYRTLCDGDVAYATFHRGGVPAGNFGAYDPSGTGEETGHAWGSGDGSMSDEEILRDMREQMDVTLRGFGWRLGGDDERKKVHVRTADRKDGARPGVLRRLTAWAQRLVSRGVGP